MTPDVKDALDRLSDASLAEMGYTRTALLRQPPPAKNAVPEARAAARWWASRLRQPPTTETGDRDPLGRAYVSWATETLNKTPLRDEQVELFEGWLAWVVQSLHVEESRMIPTDKPSWNPKEPSWGSYHRTLSVDYHPDHLLSFAARAAGFDPDARFPLKTVMWVNPGEVKVGEGYGRQPVVVYPEPK